MTGRAFASLSALSLAALVAYAAASCLDETTPSTVVVATGTPSISIYAPGDGACIPLTGGKDDFITVAVTVDNSTFYLRPPGACTNLGNCGHLQLDVDGVYNNSSATSLVDVIFEGKIANHFGEKTLTVTLVDDNGNPWLQSVDGDAGDGGDAGPNGPFSASVKIVGKTSCASSSTSTSSSTTSSTSSSSTGTGGGGTGGADAGDGG
jgi:hypothetical protein